MAIDCTLKPRLKTLKPLATVCYWRIGAVEFGAVELVLLTRKR